MSLTSFSDAIAKRVVERAARQAPTSLAARLREEWTAALSDRHGSIARLELAFGCYWAAMLIKHDYLALSTPAGSSSIGDGIVIAAAVPHGMSLFPRRASGAATGAAVCEINTTPLIDVLLVLIVTLIMTLPLLTHAVSLDLPQSAARAAPPEVVNLDIDFDGTVLWNGSPVANFAQLEAYFRTESQRSPQPEFHLRPDPYVKYGVVAQVLAAAQRNRLQKLGFVNGAEFAD
jgi:biopolymer transport protein ExbD